MKGIFGYLFFLPSVGMEKMSFYGKLGVIKIKDAYIKTMLIASTAISVGPLPNTQPRGGVSTGENHSGIVSLLLSYGQYSGHVCEKGLKMTL